MKNMNAISKDSAKMHIERYNFYIPESVQNGRFPEEAIYSPYFAFNDVKRPANTASFV